MHQDMNINCTSIISVGYLTLCPYQNWLGLIDILFQLLDELTFVQLIKRQYDFGEFTLYSYIFLADSNNMSYFFND